MAKTSVILFADQSKSPNNRCLVGVYLTSYPDSTLLDVEDEGLRKRGINSYTTMILKSLLVVI